MSADLSVAIATYNRISQLKNALKSLENIKNYTVEIVIADGGSTDGTLEFLKSSKIENLKILEQGELIGSAKAYNEAFKYCTGTYVLWFSDDTRLVGDSVDNAIAFLDQVRTIGMVGLKMKDTMGKYRNQAYLGGVCCFGILNCNHGILRNDLLKLVGGFNEEYNSYMIDPDLTASILSSGHDVCLTKEIAVLHDREWATEDPTYSRMANPAGIDNQKIYLQKFNFLDRHHNQSKATYQIKKLIAKLLKGSAWFLPNNSFLRDIRNSLLMRFKGDEKYSAYTKNFYKYQSVPPEAASEFNEKHLQR